MNPVAGSLTTTANAARENSIKGLREGERNIVSLLIAYFNRANVTTVFPFARISRLHRSTSSYAPCNAYLHFESCNSNASYPSIRVRPTRTESPAYRSFAIRAKSIDLSSLVIRQFYSMYSIEFLSSIESFQIPNNSFT